MAPAVEGVLFMTASLFRFTGRGWAVPSSWPLFSCIAVLSISMYDSLRTVRGRDEDHAVIVWGNGQGQCTGGALGLQGHR